MINSYIMRGIIAGFRTLRIYNSLKRYHRGPKILLYHGVENNIDNPLIQHLHLSFAAFEKHIKYLRENYDIISMDDLYNCLYNKYELDSSHVLITFDDGFKNNFSNVLPFLSSYKIPFSVFINTNHIQCENRLPTYYLRTAIFYCVNEYISIPSIKKQFDISTERKRIAAIKNIEISLKILSQEKVYLLVRDLMKLLPNDRWLELNNKFISEEPMTWNEIKGLHAFGVTIGSHGHDHSILHVNQSNNEIDYQLGISKEIIEKHVSECKYFAYPQGDTKSITNVSVMAVKSCGYRLGLSSVPGEISNKSNVYALPRIFASPDHDRMRSDLSSGYLYNHIYNPWYSQF